MIHTTQAAARAMSRGPVQLRLCNETLWPGGVLGTEQVERMQYLSACCDGDIGLGGVFSAQLSGVLHGSWALLGEQLTAWLGAQVQGEQLWLKLGTFVVDECGRGDDETRFTAHDALYRAAGVPYVPAVELPAPAARILLDAAGQCGLSVETSSVNLGLNLTVAELPDQCSCREVLGWLAGLCGRNCLLSREGSLRFVWFSESGAEVSAADYYDGGLSSGGASRLSGLSCTVPGREGEEGRVLTAGSAAGAAAMENPLMTQSRLDALWQDLGGWEYQVGEVSLWGGALLESGDLVNLTNRAGERSVFPVMQTVLELDGGCRCTLSAWGRSQVCRQSGEGAPVRLQALRAWESAQRALLSANGKNKVFYQASAPVASAGLTEGDLWFNSMLGNQASVWNGSQWVVRRFGYQAVENLDAGAITTGTLNAARIGSESITGDKIAANTITASKIDIDSLFAQDITSTGTFQIDTDQYKQYASREEDGFVFWSGNEQAGTGCEMHLRRNGNFSLWASDELYVFSDDTFYIDSHGGDGVKINENEPSATLEVWGESTFRADVGLRGDLSVGGDTVCSGDLSVTGAISEGGTPLSSRYSRQLEVFDTTIALSIPAGDAVDLSASVSQAGYTPIAVAGFRFTNTNSSRVMIFKSHLSGTNYHYGARNTNDVDFSGNLVVNILYVSNQ